MKRYILDTCAAIWLMEDAPLSNEAIEAIDISSDTKTRILICPFTAWEVGMLCSRGRLPSVIGPSQWYQALISLDLIEEGILSSDIMVNSSFLIGNPPRDPVDRLIIAMANHYDATIVTRDKVILKYADDGLCKALAC